MRNAKVLGGAAAAAALVIAAGVAAAPRAWRRLRAGKPEEGTWEPAAESDYAVPTDTRFGDPEVPVDEEANAALREELREKVEQLTDEPVADVATPVQADLIVEGIPGGDPATETARARLRQRAEAAKQSFKN